MGLDEKFMAWIKGLNPWMPLFAFVALFQFIRDAQLDALYFSFIVLVLALNWKNAFPFEFPRKPKPNLLGLVIGSAVLGFLIAIAPRKSAIEIALMIGSLFIALALIWYKDSGKLPSSSLALDRSKWAWISFGVLVSLWELSAYILSDVAGNVNAYPTISVLMAPVMADPVGRSVFLIIWLLIGVMLVRVERKR